MSNNSALPQRIGNATLYDRIRGWYAKHTLVADTAVTVLLIVLTVIGTWTVPQLEDQRTPDALAVLLIIMMHLPIIWRRTLPVPGLAVASVGMWSFWVLDYPIGFDGAGLLILLYSVLAYEPSRRRGWGLCVLVSLISMGIIGIGLVIDQEQDVTFATLIFIPLLFTVAAAIGDNMRHRRAYLRELEEKTANAETATRLETERAVSDERTRIARELHDVVAHSVSVMVVQAGAARRVLPTNPDQTETALVNIEETGRQSLAEMRRVLGLLRTDNDGTALAPQPTLDQFATLLKQCEDAGLSVDLDVDGARQLEPGLELACFRIVQEALTNVLKHAGPASAQVLLAYGTHDLTIKVSDNGRGAASNTGSGNGLLGMRERVELYNGTFHAGPQPGGGFAIEAVLPIVNKNQNNNKNQSVST